MCNITNLLERVRATKHKDSQFDLSFTILEDNAGVDVYVNDELALIAGYAYLTNDTEDTFKNVSNILHCNWMCQMNRERIKSFNLPKIQITNTGKE